MKMKKLIAAVLTAVMALTILPFTAFAASSNTATPSASISSKSKPKVWSGKADTSWFTGDKKSYNINNAEQLAGLAKIANKWTDLSGIAFNLTSDIRLNDISDWSNWDEKPPKNVWTPIGYSKGSTYCPFNGMFNGNGHVIEGMYAKGNSTIGYSTVGLFGYVYCGAVTSVSVQYGYSIASCRNAEVRAGGIAGVVEDSIINQCENWNVYVKAIGDTSAIFTNFNVYAGGIVGYMGKENVNMIIVALATEAILGFGGMMVNPIVFNDGSGNVISNPGIYNCSNNSYVYANRKGKAADCCAGGIVGYGHSSGVIKNCTNYASVGVPDASYKYGFSRKMGLIAGKIFNCPIVNCYCTNWDNKYKAVGIFELSAFDTEEKSSYTVIENDKMVSTVYSEKYAKVLGDAFVYRKGDLPQLAVFAKKTTTSSSKTTTSSSSSSKTTSTSTKK